MEVTDSAFSLKNMKRKENQNKLHFKKRWLLLELVADVLKLFFVVLNVFRASDRAASSKRGARGTSYGARGTGYGARGTGYGAALIKVIQTENV